jgi:glycosyltransferase involved in cell wall biosynthesis
MTANSDATNATGFPRILFVHDYRPDSQVIADLLRQLFLGYPQEKLSWWSFRRTPLHQPPDLRAGQLHEFLLPDRLVPNVRLSQLKANLLENFWVPRAARHLEQVIAREKPDLVAALLYGWSVPVLAKVRWPAGQRLHVSVWDFPDTAAGRNTLGPARAGKFVEAIHRLVRRAGSFDAICPGTLAELQMRTGRKDGITVHSGFDFHHLEALEASAAGVAGDTLRIAYVGTIISETGFLEMLAALKKVRASLPQKIVLEFFGGRNYKSRAWFEPAWMHEHGLFTDAGLVDALRRCDWGIVVMDPEGEDLRYSRFSFPNKVGTYLSAGVPLLGFGHPQSSLAQIMQEYRLGRLTTATSRAEFEKFLAESLALPGPREFFRADILQCARTEFNVAEMRTRLWRLWGVK